MPTAKMLTPILRNAAAAGNGSAVLFVWLNFFVLFKKIWIFLLPPKNLLSIGNENQDPVLGRRKPIGRFEDV